MNIEVTTVSRRSQKLTDVASAIFVITGDDIHRSGATSIPEALRMAPGVQVARVGTDKWAISVRGFNGLYANKLQVLMDGRSVYSPIFSGVLWEQQDTLMEDIERIEIIRGPAATAWGANAVNGVINIITKKAADTQGTLLTAGGGSFEHGFVGARYGGKINSQTPFRVYAKGFTRDNTTSLSGENIHNQWHSARGGFRVDHTRGNDEFTLQGDLFYMSKGDTLSRDTLSLPSTIPTSGLRGHQEGGNIRFRWDRTFSERSSVMLQTYYDHIRIRLLPVGIIQAESFDVDFQHRFSLYDSHDVTWGANFRLYHNKVFETDLVKFTPAEQTNHLYSIFIRDDISLIPDRLLFTLGTRIGHNDFTGLEVQPNARLMWTPNTDNSIWMSVSRAVRTPSRAENDVTSTVGQLDTTGLLTLPIPILLTLQGNSDFNSEKLIAYELGYRHRFSQQASIDIAGFINDYSQLRDLSFGALALSTGLPPQFILPALANNQASALTYGFETSIDWKPLTKWRLQSSYSYLNMQISSNKLLKELDPITGGADKISPQHQLSLRSNYDISEKLQLNLWLRYISKIAFYDIPDYVTMDAKLAFKPVRNVELFLVGQNLFSQNHREFVSDTIPSIPGIIPRGIYVGAQWRF
ncbi:TonB-dependent receptor plug domain-containing protein [Nitrosomonas aestuarii]|uniref:TonB-dependent receptor plug domain-containing protein n=1 Tax=Nitrosomonas aestuarii TaxID=52441 RepID=UPI000D4A2AEE|nr:TonB-dependent receptor [Nitrosomonas aestuarii]PTN11073.1 iron complex outermembrane receptor protein [Nitrosomonas aestuarii]